MYPVGNAFLEAIKKSHTVVSYVDVIDSDGNTLERIYPSAGNVRFDASSTIRGRLSIQINPEEHNFSPADTKALFHPLSGHELAPYRGLILPDGSTHVVPLGKYGLEDAEVTDRPSDYEMSISAMDRGREVQRAGYSSEYVVPTGTNFATAIQDLIEDRRPGRFTFDFDDIDAVTPLLIFGAAGTEDNDPWEDATETAEQAAHEVYFDYDGVCRFREQPIVVDNPTTFTYEVGNNSVLLGINKQQSNRVTHNHVIVFGESADGDVVVGEAMDDNPDSNTYVGNPVGTGDYYSPVRMVSEYVTTESQAIALAQAKLRQSLGTLVNADFTAIPNPALEVGDILEFERERIRLPGKFILQRLTIPLSPREAMNGVLLETRI